MNDTGVRGGSTDGSIEAHDAAVDSADDPTLDGGDASLLACGRGADTPTGSPCAESTDGVFAIKTVLDVWWEDDVSPPLFDSGRSSITIVHKATIADACDDGTLERVELKTCGLSLPTVVSSATCKAYQMVVADSVWDEPSMPVWETRGSISSFDVGGVLELDRLDALIGIELVNDGAEWPPAIDRVMCGAGSGHRDACFPDHDGDGFVGLPFSLVNLGMNYRESGCGLSGDQPVRFDNVRLDALGVACEPDCRKAAMVHAGIRLSRFAARAASSSCDADGARLIGGSSASAVEMRAIGCETNEGGPCVGEEPLFVDTMLPSFSVLAADAAPPATVMADPCDCPDGCMGATCALDQTPSVGPRTAMVWLGDEPASYDCEDVRSAVEAAYPGYEF